jgi:uncharacterized protein (DUF2147 family)
MKQVLVSTVLALACVAAFAQTSAAGKIPESGAVPTDPKNAAAAQNKVDARKAANPSADGTMTKKMPESETSMTSAKTGAAADANVNRRMTNDATMMMAMDTNGDGMISRQEYDAHHSGMWKKMKLKNGRATVADVEAAMKAGNSR